MTNEKKWTEEFPTPWRLGGISAWSIEAANGKTICEIWGRDPGPTEDLMIAAPELYEALEQVVFRMHAQLKLYPEQGAESKALEMLDKWGKLLAKARGESPDAK